MSRERTIEEELRSAIKQCSNTEQPGEVARKVFDITFDSKDGRKNYPLLYIKKGHLDYDSYRHESIFNAQQLMKLSVLIAKLYIRMDADMEEIIKEVLPNRG